MSLTFIKAKKLRLLFTHILVAIVTLAIIYLTPLKNVNIIDPKFNDVEPTQFYSEYSQNPDKFLFIDVRDPAAYKYLHAKGSINMPLHTLYDQRAVLPKNSDKTIVLICSGGQASGVGFMYLQHYGFFNIARITGGIGKWVEDKLPVEGDKLNVSLSEKPLPCTA